MSTLEQDKQTLQAKIDQCWLRVDEIIANKHGFTPTQRRQALAKLTGTICDLSDIIVELNK